MIADVVFSLPLERSFHYLVPAPLEPGAQPGVRVRAPFGPRELTGFIVRRLAQSPVRSLKAIRRLVDPSPVIPQQHWALASWLSSYYGCSLGEALGAMVPSALRLRLEDGAAGGLDHEPGALPLRLTTRQQAAFTVIRRALERPSTRTVLIQGVTGSGKTELYLQAVDLVLRQGRSAIVLIPEISLSPQMLDRFRERFGTTVAAWHSRLTARQRAQAWAGMVEGRQRIIVGARSAVFAPLPRVGVIILDEEHETTYKQDDAPRYHAREVAKARARLSGALVLLGSATPSIESYYASTQGRDLLVTLPERVQGRAMPTTDIVDLRETWAGRRLSVLSPHLERALEQTVTRGEQAMLLLNRRGFARVAQCPACGAVVRCRRCAVPLVYHAARSSLVCHYCSFHQPPPEMCPACRKGYVRLRGAGTERVESELHRLFPTAAISRMDLDTTRGRDRHREVYEAVKQRRVGVLVGTQMIAKGLDFPQVTLVGIVSADTELNLPDFRAGERTFDLLTQMAGRAGRGALPGRVLIQTYCPGHYAIRAAARHDYAGFYAEEIAMRRRLRLPPFTHLLELTLRGSPLRRVETAAAALAQALRGNAAGRRLTLLGPAPHRVARVRGAYQICVLLKGARVEPLVDVVRQTLQAGRKFQGFPVRVDVDPL